MTTGALIFAFDTDHTRYLDMAAWSAERIKFWLDIPVAVVTNNPAAQTETVFDRVIAHEPDTNNHRWFGDLKQSVLWLNRDRVSAYDLSPWDQTLLLDADYVVNSNQLRDVLAAPQDFLCFGSAYNMARPEEPFLSRFGHYDFPMYWATVMMFRRSAMAAYIFDAMTMVRANWQHYRDLYHIAEHTYRNDFALSIALGIVSGHTLQVSTIPWPMANVLPEDRLTCTDDRYWTVQYSDSHNQRRTMSFFDMDFHAMGKQDLGAIVETHRRTRLRDHGLELAHS